MMGKTQDEARQELEGTKMSQADKDHILPHKVSLTVSEKHLVK